MFLIHLVDFSISTHAQLAIYTVFDEESESEVKKCRILEPGGKNEKNDFRQIGEYFAFLILVFSLNPLNELRKTNVKHNVSIFYFFKFEFV